MNKEKMFIIAFVLLFIGSIVGLYILNAGSGAQTSRTEESSQQTDVVPLRG